MPSNTGRSPSGAATASAAARVKPPAKTARRRKSACSVGREQVVAPGDRVAHRALPRRQVAAAAGQQGQPLLEPGQERRRRQDLHPGRGKLDGQRQAVEAAADGGDGGGVCCSQREVRQARLRALDEERDRGDPRQLLESAAERSAAGSGRGGTGNSRSPRTCSGSRLVARMVSSGQAASKRGHVRRGLQHLLAVVEDEQQPLAGEVSGQRVAQRLPGDLPHAERGGNRRYDERRIGQRREIDEEDAIGITDRAPRRRLSSASRVLPVPPGPVSVTSRAPSSVEQAQDRRDFLLPADEAWGAS